MKKIVAHFHWLNKNILGFGLASFFSDFGHEMGIAILPAFVVQLVGPAAAPQVLGLVSGASDAAASFLKIFSGAISDRLHMRKPFIVAGYAIAGIFVGALGFATSAWQVLVYKTLAWTGKGLREPARDAAIAESVDRKFYGRAFGFHRTMDTLGAIIGPFIAYCLSGLMPLATIFFITLLPSLGSVLSIIFLTHDEPLTTRTKIVLGNFFEQFKQLPHNFNYFVGVMFIFGIGNFNKTLLILHAQQLLTGTHPLTAAALGMLLYAFFSCARACAEYTLGLLSDYIGRVMLLSFVGFGFFGIVSLFMMLSSSSFAFLVPIFMLAGISAAAVSALEKAYAADLLPAHVRGTGFGVLQTIDGIGDFVSSIFVGFLWTFFSPAYGFLYAAIMSFFAMVLLLMHSKIK